MRIVNFFGKLLVVLALALLGLGLWLWLAGYDVTEQAGKLWYELSVSSLNGFQVIIQRHLHLPAVWDSFIVPMLLVRAAWEAILLVLIALMGVGGILLALSGRKESASSRKKYSQRN